MPNRSRVVSSVARVALLALLASAASLAAQAPARWHGVPYTLPAGWTTRLSDDVLLLVPPDARDGDGETYGFLFDGELKDVAGEALGEAITAAAESLLEGSTQKSDLSGKVGALDGRTIRYVLARDGETARELRFVVFLAEGGVASLFFIASSDRLDARRPMLAAIVDSLGRTEVQKPKRKPFGLGKQGEGDGAGPGEEPAKPKRGNPLLHGKDRAAGESDESADTAETDAVRLQGGKEQIWCGIAIDLPADWRTQPGEQDALLLLPPDFGQSGVLDEVYALCGDGSLKSLDAADVVEQLQGALNQIQPGLTPRGTARAAKFGALAGKEFVFGGATPDGQDVEARVFAFPTPGGIRALLGLGFPGKLTARARVVTSMLGSLRTQRGAAGQETGGAAAAQALAGQWVYFSSFTANNGGGSSNQAVVTLRADGTYDYNAENCSTNPFGAAWGDARSTGTFVVRGDAIVFTPRGEEPVSYRLEKRNHPKNNDPMIVLDGKAFVTATQRRPW